MSTNNRDPKVLPQKYGTSLSTPEQSQINCSQQIHAKGVSSFPAPSLFDLTKVSRQVQVRNLVQVPDR
jgi:hypothetical protein